MNAMGMTEYEKHSAANYSAKDVQAIKDLYKEYEEGCEQIAADCEKEGYPAHGANYDLRVGQLWDSINSDIELIESKYEEVQE